MMEFLTVGGFLLSALGVCLAIVAMVQAGGAKKAVARVLNKSSEQVTRDDSRDLLTKLQLARDAALARRGKKGPIPGRAAAKDIELLKLAQDSLATTTVGMDVTLEDSLRLAANQLDEALKEIQGAGQRDGWADALGVIQGVTPKVNTHQRQLGTKALQS